GKPDVGLEPPQQRRPGARCRAPVLPVVKAAVGDEQPVLLQLGVEPAAQCALAAGLERVRADRGQHRRVRRALADRDHLALGNAPGEPSFPALGYPNAAAFAGVSGTSHAIPSILISRHRPRNAPAVSIVATGLATWENSSAIGSGPSRCRAWVVP